MKKIISLLGVLAIAPIINAQAEAPAQNAAPAVVASKTSTPAGWLDDFAAAKKQAAKEGKLILADFSGSDWCHWCVRLDEEVLSKEEFQTAAKEKFVLLFIDSPHDKSKLSETAKKNNPALVEKYGIRGFPSVLILSENGDLLEQTGYRRGGPQPYLAHLDELVEQSRAIIELSKELKTLKKGTPERARKIDSVVRELSVRAQVKHDALVQEVLDFDADGALGLRKNYPYFTEFLPQEKRVRELNAAMEKELMGVLSALPKEQAENREIAAAKAKEVLAKYVDGFKKLRAETLELDEKSSDPVVKSSFKNLAAKLGKVIDFAEGKTK